MTSEANLEMYYASKLAFNVGQGLKHLKPASINAGIKALGDVPRAFSGLNEWVDAFLAFQVARKPKEVDRWADPAAKDDVELYVSRKIWSHKMDAGTAENPSAAAIAALTHLSQYARAQAHEAINHSVKHNTAIENLLTEMHDHVDQVLLTNFTTKIGAVAGALMQLHPEIAGIVTQQKAISHE